MAELPQWAQEIVALYESGASSQFIVHGNVHDTFLLPTGDRRGTGDLERFLEEVLLAPFDVILAYDLGRGLRVLAGGSHLEDWPSHPEGGRLPHQARDAVALCDHFLRYAANLRRVGGRRLRVAVLVEAASLVVPASASGWNHELSALALRIRSWSESPELIENGFATFLVTENLNDLHPLLATNPRAARIEVPLPSEPEIEAALVTWKDRFPAALSELGGTIDAAADQMAGASLGALLGLLKRREHEKRPLALDDLARLKRRLVEEECQGLIEFLEGGKHGLDAVHGQQAIVEWLRQDIALWNRNDLRALPMGYLFCGPVGTGKTFLVKCLAGEAAVPVVRFKNFRDRWVGSTESNLEKIFRLLHALGRCIVFVDEADQALGRRGGGSGDSGVSGRVYSMMAEEMSKTSNRGRILWILASSRPDLIEVDLKRPGRVDVKIPIFPAATAEESYALLHALCGKFDVPLEAEPTPELAPLIPREMTAGAAEALAVKTYRLVQTRGLEAAEALRQCLVDYQNPIPRETMDFQIELAVREASDLSFVPPAYRP